MANKITVSFKNTSKDLKLFSYLNSLEDKSGEIKDMLRLAMKVLEEEENKK